jgi:hypothetical protein
MSAQDVARLHIATATFALMSAASVSGWRPEARGMQRVEEGLVTCKLHSEALIVERYVYCDAGDSGEDEHFVCPRCGCDLGPAKTNVCPDAACQAGK